jgi:hypothetical protein
MMASDGEAFSQRPRLICKAIVQSASCKVSDRETGRPVAFCRNRNLQAHEPNVANQAWKPQTMLNEGETNG